MNEGKGFHCPFLKKKKNESEAGGDKMAFEFLDISDCLIFTDCIYTMA